ncbi:GDA1/CD39 nucleoside phosphatase family protein (macronuclear) [Tetrahymena thermophila SB210]|uniref:GDA1/CD39 nucleoside phosphatase family protein n=1 Tax=Tetrahymena thermophila (strain SB210) TaxID=312017 RepID=I7MAI6_TETTS|nr:GDA1/CD39 nucleoside phosphatase family protein [Tetrahymena thermophila SB210]EAS04668.2 GDA1/CD39 nucleoside phosphatase family protein [Tetrahymena thermophila SB210]|eukprot:XP_001024913.2 GDA1/CD39 nucleoside phosphatase family protein [Tetrahymena thermophila SB210]
MKNLTIFILLCLSIQMFVCKNEAFDRNQRILRELAETQDTCLYVLLDAGSSSTKIRLYKSVCRRSSQIPQLEALTIPKDKDGKDLFADKIKVGDNKKNALTDVVLTETDFTNYFDVAFKIISDMKQYYKFDIKPFLFLRATAGLRLLPQQQQEQILNLVRTVFRKQDSFYFLDDSWVKIITGEEEGLFLWLSVNYAYQKIKHQNIQQFDVSKTIAVIDIGGASAQTAFYSNSNNKLIDLPEKTRVQIYSNTILGYGNDQIIASVLGTPDFASCFQKTDGFTHTLKDQNKNDVVVSGDYDFVKCTNAMLTLLKITDCQYKNDDSVVDCSASSQLKKLTGQKQIIGASSVFYAKQELYKKLNKEGDTFILKDFRELAKQYCQLTLTQDQFKANDRTFTSCIQMMWVSTFLIDGLGLLNDQVTTLQQYNSYNIDWSIGSLIYDINALQCDYLDMNQCSNKIEITDVNKDQQNNTFSSSLIINSYFSIIALLIIKLFI